MLYSSEFRNHKDIERFIARISRSDIDLLIDCLQKEAILRDEKSKKESERKKSEIKIIDFVSEYDMTTRLKNGLLQMSTYYNYIYIDDFTKKELLQKSRNCGKKSWEEFVGIINHSMQGSRFEAQQKILQNHFIQKSLSIP
jgi:hypothetical protein